MTEGFPLLLKNGGEIPHRSVDQGLLNVNYVLILLDF